MKTKKKTTTVRNKPLLWLLAGVLTVVLIACAVLFFLWSSRFGKESTGEHPIANQLSDSIDILPYMKDGNIYYYKNGVSTLIAENAYDTESDEPAFTANYGIEAKTGKMVYLSEGVLYLFDGSTVNKIAENVTSWRTGGTMEYISFTTKQSNSTKTGLLYMYTGGVISLVDTSVTVATVRFSQNGCALFYEKENVYPNVRSTLYKYENGVRTVVHESSYPVLWVNSDGTRLITGENYDDGLYTYRLFTDDLSRTYEFSNVYFSEISDDQSIAYLLCDYDLERNAGTLIAVEMSTLKTKKLASSVSFINSSAVTDSSKGIVYSVLSDYERDLYSIYYGDISGNSIRLILNTTEESLYNVIVNSENKDGYILSYGATKNNGGVYYFTYDKSAIETTRLASGYVDALNYYEESHSVTYIMEPSGNVARLYHSDKSGNTTLITDACGVTYSEASMNYSSQSVLSSDNKALYFNDIVTGDTTVDTKGTMLLSGTVIDFNVSSAYMEAPVADRYFNKIFYLKEENGKLDLYLYENASKTLIAQDVHGIFELKKG